MTPVQYKVLCKVCSQVDKSSDRVDTLVPHGSPSVLSVSVSQVRPFKLLAATLHFSLPHRFVVRVLLYMLTQLLLYTFVSCQRKTCSRSFHVDDDCQMSLLSFDCNSCSSSPMKCFFFFHSLSFLSSPTQLSFVFHLRQFCFLLAKLSLVTVNCRSCDVHVKVIIQLFNQLTRTIVVERIFNFTKNDLTFESEDC